VTTSTDPPEHERRPRLVVAVAPEHIPPAMTRFAARLAADLGAEVEVCTVVAPHTSVDPQTGLADDGTQGSSRALRVAEQVAEELHGWAVAVSVRVLEGRPADALVAHATEEPPNYLVMATHGRTGLRRALVGSVAEAVVRRSPCPVVVVPPGADDQPSRSAR